MTKKRKTFNSEGTLEQGTKAPKAPHRPLASHSGAHMQQKVKAPVNAAAK